MFRFTNVWMAAAYVAVAIFCLAGPAQANLIATNAGFESVDTVGAWSVAAGVTDITDWTVSAGPVHLYESAWTGWGTTTATEGTQFLLFYKDAQVGVKRSFATTPGTIYNVSFDRSVFASEGPVPTTDSTLGYGITGVTSLSDTVTYDTGYPIVGSSWVNKKFSFTAAGSSSELFFTRLNVGFGGGAAIDNVVVNAAPAPEPGTVAMLIAGLIGLLAYAWRKRR